MKQLLLILLAAAVPCAAFCAEEDDYIKVLQASHDPGEKDAACAKLKWIGTARAVPELEKLLTNNNLSHSARYALESMQGPEAEKALIAGLGQTTGSNQVGIINSLGIRGDGAAIPELEKLLSTTNTEVVAASATALGHIAGPASVQILESAWKTVPAGPGHDAVVDSLLACANQLLTSDNFPSAAKIFGSVYDRERDEGVRCAAYRGLMASSEKKGIVMMVEAIRGTDPVKQGAALPLAVKLGGAATSQALAESLQKISPAMQIALLQALQQRGDGSIELYVAEMLDSTDADVRRAAIEALGELGNGFVAGRLARIAATAAGEEQTEARRALINLRRGAVTRPILKILGNVTPEERTELIRALGERGDSAAAPKMVELARTNDPAVRTMALQALSQLAEAAEIPAMIQFVVSATNDDFRAEATDALNAACQNIQARKHGATWTRLAEGAMKAPAGGRIALFTVCSGVTDPRVRDALRTSALDSDARIHAAALRAICSSQDEQLLPDIVRAATNTSDEHVRLLGIRGCVRLIAQDNTTLKPAQKTDALQSILKSNPNAEGKRLVLSALGSIPTTASLDMASSLLGDAEVKGEASAAVKKIATDAKDEAIRKSAQATLDNAGKLN